MAIYRKSNPEKFNNVPTTLNNIIGGAADVDVGIQGTPSYDNGTFTWASITSVKGLTAVGDDFFVIDQTGSNIRKYTDLGNLLATYSISSQTTNAKGICYDETFLWVIDASENVYKYNTSGVYQSVTFSVSAKTLNSEAIEFFNNQFYITGKDDFGTTDYGVFIYTTGGTFVSFTSTQSQDRMGGITNDGAAFWMVGINNRDIYKFNHDLTFASINFDILAELGTTGFGVAFKNNALYATGSTTKMFRYSS